ncbi:MAG TPA: acyl-CoA dehydrogenase, partial [Hyphomicrobiaceae bacterium]
MTKTSENVSIPIDPGWEEIRDGVRHVCSEFPNEYWVKLDHASEYPTAFVDALTKAGYLG